MAMSLGRGWLGELGSVDKGERENLIISGGNWDQGLTPVEDLPLVEGSWDFVVLSIGIDCPLSRKSAALVTALG